MIPHSFTLQCGLGASPIVSDVPHAYVNHHTFPTVL